MRAFLSYNTEDRNFAAKVCTFFENLNIPAFMAHEHIRAAQNWNEAILTEIGKADLFVAILSEHYLHLPFCLQESGIAVFRMPKMTIIPVSLDGTNPPGFMGPVQAKKMKGVKFSPAPFYEGLAERDVGHAVQCMIDHLSKVDTYADAEADFAVLWQYLDDGKPEEIVRVLEAAATNNQIAYANGCKRGLRELLLKFGALLKPESRNYLENVLN